MKEYVDISMLANLVSMLRADIDGAILLSDDLGEGRFYEKCKHIGARVIASPTVALELLNIVEERGVLGVAAAVRRRVHSVALPQAAFSPDLGDVASMLLASNCFQSTFQEIGGEAWVRASEKQVGSMVNRAACIASVIENLGLDESDNDDFVAISKFIDWGNFEIDCDKIDSTVRAVASKTGALVAEASSKSTEELLAGCDGALVIKVLAAATELFHPRGLRSERKVRPSDLLSMLRVAFDVAELEGEKMFWRIRTWERMNPAFPLLRQWRQRDPLQMVLDQRYWETDLKAMLSDDPHKLGLSAFKLDLDNFKSVNEMLGHSGGDEAIRVACKALLDCAANRCEVYRRGGDELLAFAPALHDRESLELAELMRATIETKMAEWGGARGLTVCPTASIGVVDAAFGSSYDDVVMLMDRAQLQAKQEGKNRVVVLKCGSTLLEL